MPGALQALSLVWEREHNPHEAAHLRVPYLSVGDGTEQEEEVAGDDSSQAQLQPASPMNPGGSPFTSMGPTDEVSPAGSIGAMFQGKAMEWATHCVLLAW